MINLLWVLFGVLVFVNMMMLGDVDLVVFYIGGYLVLFVGDNWVFFVLVFGVLGLFFFGFVIILNFMFLGI